ncbi:hypothetical protein OSB04_025515 [Centaurea solstitialis]|uniref:Myb-like domain-containing protein n=1 Tax=Centaurea solstitialis TaxID=347529 RepID=A0AA38SVT0_9ASTR|nr:hypothetical protein OSB04_025515 [Centaurea solstitialis]
MLPESATNSADAAAAAPPQQPPQQQPPQQQPAAAVEFSEEDRGIRFEGERSSGGSSGWPRQETLALIKIRSDMDFAFREATSKGPLWDEVSRKLGELGYHRSGKKCKEKFENVYKYHKRTKEGRTSKADGKTYRFFEQLEALEANLSGGGGGGGGASHTTPPPSMAAASNITVPSVAIPFGSHPNNNVSPISVAAPAVAMPHVGGAFPFSHPNASISMNTTSSSNSDEEDEAPAVRKKRKRKWKDFFGRLMKEVIHKQEELQMKFLDQIEKRERERMAREEAWRMEEMAKMNREHDMLVHERSISAAKDAAVITFLQKITEQNPNAAVPQILQNQPPPPPQPQTIQQPQLQNQQPQQAQTIQQQQNQQPTPPPAPVSVAPAVPPPPQHQFQVVKSVENISGGELVKANTVLSPSPSRWPKAEVNALINLRTTLDMKYQDSGPKGPLWEEISAGMLRLGYNRNAKRCKEKWENINKYYKKVKESSKKRPQDSKTCPYFHQLDAIYRQKANNNNPTRLLPESSTQMEAIMAEPEQQWPLPAMVQQSTIHRENIDQNNEDDYDDEDEDEDDEGGEYEIVSNKNSSSSMGAVRVTEA